MRKEEKGSYGWLHREVVMNPILMLPVLEQLKTLCHTGLELQ